MLKFTFHSLRRARERGLSLDAIADWVIGSCPFQAMERKTRFPIGDMTVVAKQEGKEVVVITAWKTQEPARRIK